MQRLWGLEEVSGEDSSLTADKLTAVTYFQDTYTRDAHGRYVVSLPRRTPPPKLGKSREMVLRRYLSNERSLHKVEQWETFHQGVQDYLDLGHAELVPARDLTLPAVT